jgi:hypothetical protein
LMTDTNTLERISSSDCAKEEMFTEGMADRRSLYGQAALVAPRFHFSMANELTEPRLRVLSINCALYLISLLLTQALTSMRDSIVANGGYFLIVVEVSMRGWEQVGTAEIGLWLAGLFQKR